MNPKCIFSLCFLLTLLSTQTFSQVGIGTANPNSSAQLDISSTTKGLLVPRMTSIQRISITTPAEGLVVYQTDFIKGYYLYNGSVWSQLLADGYASLDNLSDVKYGGTNFTGSLLVGQRNTGSLNAANYNTGVGYYSLYSLTSGTYNSSLGFSALKANSTGSRNTAIGAESLYSSTSGPYNTAVGYQALYNNTTGSNNTAIGYQAGNWNTSYSNTTCLGNYAQVTGDNQVQLGDVYTTTYAFGVVQTRSDGRDKKDIHDTELGLDFILSLRPVDYHYDYRERYSPGYYDSTYSNPKNDGHLKNENYNHGFIAQEVQEIVKEKGLDFGGVNHVAEKGGKDVYYLGYTEFIAPLTKAIQEQHAIIKGQEQKINELTELVSKLAKRKRRK